MYMVVEGKGQQNWQGRIVWWNGWRTNSAFTSNTASRDYAFGKLMPNIFWASQRQKLLLALMSLLLLLAQGPARRWPYRKTRGWDFKCSSDHSKPWTWGQPDSDVARKDQGIGGKGKGKKGGGRSWRPWWGVWVLLPPPSTKTAALDWKPHTYNFRCWTHMFPVKWHVGLCRCFDLTPGAISIDAPMVRRLLVRMLWICGLPSSRPTHFHRTKKIKKQKKCILLGCPLSQ